VRASVRVFSDRIPREVALLLDKFSRVLGFWPLGADQWTLMKQSSSSEESLG
jgi:hypothetical protein